MEVNEELWPGWKTVRQIGAGGFGAVYEIQRELFGEMESAALKVLSIPGKDMDIEDLRHEGYDLESITTIISGHLKSIVAEYSLMQKMKGSSNVVSCDDVRAVQHPDGIGWDIFIKMELLTPLMKVLPKSIPEETVIRLANDMAQALKLCRKYNIVHRDIKPQNILYSKNGDFKLGDFGVAKIMESASAHTKGGTPRFMAPEVYNNQPYNISVDIYSLGIVLYWMLNNRRTPFEPQPPAVVSYDLEQSSLQQRFHGAPLPPPVNGSEGLKRIVLKACAFSPADRYQTPEELLEDLHKLGSGSDVPVRIADHEVSSKDAIAYLFEHPVFLGQSTILNLLNHTGE